MPKLIVSMDGLVLNEFPLTQGKVRVGRAPSSDIRLDNRAISSEHLRVFLNDDRTYSVEDLDSTNGTTVNGQKITQRALKNNDIIGLGKYCIKYVEDNEFDQERLTSEGVTFERTNVEELIAERRKFERRAENADQKLTTDRRKDDRRTENSPSATSPKSIYQTRNSVDLAQTSSSIPFATQSFSGSTSSGGLSASKPNAAFSNSAPTNENPKPTQARMRLIHGDIVGRAVPIDPNKPVRVGHGGHVGRIMNANGVWYLAHEQGEIPAVNGIPINAERPRALKHGDRVSVGALLLEFLND